MRPVHLPRTLDELWGILKTDPKTLVYAGGTDLLVKMRSEVTVRPDGMGSGDRDSGGRPSGTVNPPAFACLERMDELKRVRDHGHEVFIGAVTTHSCIVKDRLIRERFPVLAKAAGVLGSPPIRHMGTIGGNIITASPAGDLLPALHVLAAEVELASTAERRRMPLRDFITGPGTVALRKGEILTGVWLPSAPQWSLHLYEKVGRRKAQACAVASLAAVLEVSDVGRIDRVKLAWGSVGPTVVTSPHVEEALTGRLLCETTLRAAMPLVENAVSPIHDVRASAEYRRMVAGRLLLRLAGCGSQ